MLPILAHKTVHSLLHQVATEMYWAIYTAVPNIQRILPHMSLCWLVSFYFDLLLFTWALILVLGTFDSNQPSISKFIQTNAPQSTVLLVPRLLFFTPKEKPHSTSALLTKPTLTDWQRFDNEWFRISSTPLGRSFVRWWRIFRGLPGRTISVPRLG